MLKYGSSVSFLSDTQDGYLCGEEFADISLVLDKVHETGGDFLSSVFQVVPALYYKAQQSASEHLGKLEKAKRESVGLQAYIDEYNKASQSANTEVKMNQERVEKLKGSVVKYGDTIQLLHVKSHKFLTLRPSILSSTERDCLRLDLDNDSSGENCQFVVTPGYKHVSDGHPVLLHENIHITNAKWRMYVHVSKSGRDTASASREVNASSESTRWKITQFTASEESDNHNYLRAGDAIWMFHSEAEVFITADTYNKLPWSFTGAATNHAILSLQLRNPADGFQGSSKGVFVIEYDDPTQGGVCRWNRVYRFRHLCSGLYLSLVEISSNSDSPRRRFSIHTKHDALANQPLLGSAFVFTLSPYRDSKGEFRLVSSGVVSSDCVSRDCYIRLQHCETSRWLHVSKFLSEEGEVADLVLNSSLPSVQHVIDSADKTGMMLIAETKMFDDDVIHLFKVNTVETREARFLVSSLPKLNEYVRALKNNSDSETTSRHLLEAVESRLKSLIDFVCSHHHTFDASVGRPMTRDPNPIRQQILAEQHVLNLLVEMLSCPFQTWNGPFKMEDISVLKRSAGSMRLANKMDYISHITRLTYNLILNICVNNTTNQLAASRYFPIFEKQVGFDLGAEETLTKLLTDNEQLLQSLPTETIEMFMELLVTRGKNPQYLQFLRSICTCSGEAVSVNQDRLYAVLFKKNGNNADSTTESVLIQTRVTDSLTVEVLIPADLEGEPGWWMELLGFYACNHEYCDYFTSMLQLFADLSHGRHYLSIEEIRQMFPLDVIFRYLTTSTLRADARAALCRLLLTVYIDCDPFEPKRLPRLTLLSDLNMNSPEGSTADVKERAKPIYGKIKRFITNYLTGIENPPLITADSTFMSSPTTTNLTTSSTSASKPISRSSTANLSEHKQTQATGSSPHPQLLHRNASSIQMVQMGSSSPRPNQNSLAESQLTLAVVTLALKMLQFGIFDNTDDIRAMVPHLVQFLQLRKKSKRPDSGKPVHYNQQPNIATAVRRKRLFGKQNRVLPITDALGMSNTASQFMNRRFDSTLDATHEPTLTEEEEKAQMAVRLQVCRILQYVMDIRFDANILQMFKIFSQSNAINSNQGADPKNQTYHVVPARAKGKDILNAVQFMENETVNAHPTINLTNLSASTLIHAENSDLKTKLGSIQSMLVDCDLVGVLLDVINYSDSVLQTAATDLLVRYFSQNRDLREILPRIQILDDFDAVLLYKTVLKRLVRLKQLAERSEYWIGALCNRTASHVESAQMVNMAEELQSGLSKLIEVVYASGADKSKDRDSKRDHHGSAFASSSVRFNREQQKLIWNLDVHSFVISLLKDTMTVLPASSAVDSGVSSIQWQSPLHEHLVTDIIRLSFTFLSAFAADNADSQEVLFDNLHVFMRYLCWQDVGQTDLITNIFKNNKSLCLKIREDFVREFAQQIIKNGYDYRFLEPLIIVQYPNGYAVKQNQNLVLNVLTDAAYRDKILIDLNRVNEQFINSNLPLYYAPSKLSEEFPFYLRPVFMVDSVSKQRSSSSASDGPFEPYVEPVEMSNMKYAIRLMELFSACSMDKNYVCEAKSQGLWFLDDLVPLIQNERTNLPFRAALSAFVLNAYIDTEKLAVSVESNYGLLKLFTESFTTLSLALVSEKPTQEICFIVDVMLPSFIFYVEEHCSKSEPEPLEITMAEAVAAGIHNLLNICTVHACSLAPTRYRNVLKCIELLKIIDFGHELAQGLLKIELELSGYKSCFETSEKREGPEPTVAVVAHGSITSLWNQFTSELSWDRRVAKMVSSEFNLLASAVHSTNFEELVRKLIIFAKEGPYRQVKTETMLAVFSLLSVLMETATDRVEMQNKLNDMGASTMVLSLMCDQTDSQFFYSLIDLCISLLEGGNTEVQNTFYQYFVNHADSEFFFAQIHKEFEDQSAVLDEAELTGGNVPSAYKGTHPMWRLLRLLQLFTENHHSTMQNYMHIQIASGYNHDLVTVCVDYLSCLARHLNQVNIALAIQCLNTLTEFIQGPCLDNQMAMVDAKFLQVAVTILESPAATKLLKYKCLLTLTSLLEGRKDVVIQYRMIHTLDPVVLKRNLQNLYRDLHVRYQGAYIDEAFLVKLDGSGGEDEEEHDSSAQFFHDMADEENRMVIDMGFVIFALMKILTPFDGSEDKMFVPKVLDQRVKGINQLKKSVFGQFGSLSIGVLLDGVTSIKGLASKIRKTTIGDKGQISKNQQAKHAVFEEMLYSHAYSFFSSHTGTVEVVRDGQLEKLHFPIPPLCSYLTQETKDKVVANIDRDSPNSKIADFFFKSFEMIEEMKHQKWLHGAIQKLPVLGQFASRVKLWKDVSFALALAINFMVLLTGEDQIDTVYILGTCQTVTSCVILFLFTANNAPLIVSKGFRKRDLELARGESVVEPKEAEQPKGHQNALKKLSHSFACGLLLASNPFMLYYMVYVVFTFLGSYVDVSFFAFHLFDIIVRYQELRNVIRAVTKSGVQLLLTYALFWVVMYVFALLAYLFIASDFQSTDGSPACGTVLVCLLTAYDQAFKNNGGVGAFLQPYSYDNFDSRSIFRYMFDNLFNVILMMVLVNCVFGVIIDTFGALRDEHQKNRDDTINKCFICNLDRYTFDRMSQAGFNRHIKEDHWMWNYLYLITYLQMKPVTELTGVESYILERILRKDLSWFPLHRAMVLDAGRKDDHHYADDEEKALAADDQKTDKHKQADKQNKRKSGNGGRNGKSDGDSDDDSDGRYPKTFKVDPNVDSVAALERKLMNGLASMEKRLQTAQHQFFDNVQQRLFNRSGSPMSDSSGSIDFRPSDSSSSPPSQHRLPRILKSYRVQSLSVPFASTGTSASGMAPTPNPPSSQGRSLSFTLGSTT